MPLNLNHVSLAGGNNARPHTAFSVEVLAGNPAGGTGSADSTDPRSATFKSPGGMCPLAGDFDPTTCTALLICDNKNALIRRLNLRTFEVDTVLDLTNSTQAGGSPLSLGSGSEPHIATLNYCTDASVYIITGVDDTASATGHVWRWAGPGNNAVNISNNFNSNPRCGLVVDDDFYFLAEPIGLGGRTSLYAVIGVGSASSVTTSGGGLGTVGSSAGASGGYFAGVGFDSSDGGGDDSWHQNEMRGATDPQVVLPVVDSTWDLYQFDVAGATTHGITIDSAVQGNRSLAVWNDGTDWRIVSGGSYQNQIVATMTSDDAIPMTVTPADFSTDDTDGAILVDPSSGNDALPTMFRASSVHTPLVWDNGEVWFCSGGTWETSADESLFHGIWRPVSGPTFN